MTEALIEPFAPAHLDGLIALVAAEGWTEYADDVDRTHRALTAPGVTTLVATLDRRVVGAIQVQSDGLIQAHVSMLLIDRNSRGSGLESRLLRNGLDANQRFCVSSAPKAWNGGGRMLASRTRAEAAPIGRLILRC